MAGDDFDEFSGPPARDFIGPGKGCGLHGSSPGARKEKLRERAFTRPEASRRPVPYIELRAASAFSFLNGASPPEDLVERAAALDLPAVALVDTNGVYGAPRFYKAAKAAGIKALVGAEVVLEEGRRRGSLRRPGALSERLSEFAPEGAGS